MALVFLFWGEIFLVFPAVCGDSFGVTHATANNGLLYTAQGTAALTVPLANVLAGWSGAWSSVLVAAGCCSLLAAGILAKLALVPMRKTCWAQILQFLFRLSPLAFEWKRYDVCSSSD
jgi:MFS transporter, OFA family, oxalate/formate antiporter